MSYEDFNKIYQEALEIESKRAKKIKNNYFVKAQASKFNSNNTVHDFLISNFGYMEEDNKYLPVNNNKYVNYNDNNNYLVFFISRDKETGYIKGLREGAPTTAFDCLVALKFEGDDYAAALDIYRNPYKYHINNQQLLNSSTPQSFSPLPYPIDPTFQPSAYGIGDWMKFDEYLDNDLFRDQGIPLCVVESVQDNSLYRLYYSDERHLITIAPNGTGKGTCVQIPVLLQYDAPMLVIDPKGENAAVTAKYRKEGMCHNVLILNPFNILREHFEAEGFKSENNQFESACFNPLDALNPEDDHFYSDVSALSEALIDTRHNDPYWSDSARELVNCLILYICTSKEFRKEDRNLARMRCLLTGTKDEFLITMQAIVESGSNSEFAPMTQKAKRFLEDNKTIQSIISTAITETSFLDDPILAKSLSSNDIDFLKLKEGKMTVYVILPAKLLSVYSKWFKLVVTSAINALMSTHKQADKKVLIMLDECPILGRLSCVETAVGLARGYGIQIWSFWQDIHQLNDVYKERAESFLANAGVQQYFTPNDMTMAEKLSNRIGNTTIFSRSENSNITYGNVIQNNRSISHSETNVPFIKPVMLFGMSSDRQLLFLSGKEKSIFAIKHPYYVDNSCKKRSSSNPYFNG